MRRRREALAVVTDPEVSDDKLELQTQEGGWRRSSRKLVADPTASLEHVL
jgi:hypothetical protein